MISTTGRRYSLYKLDGGASASAARRESGLISGGGRNAAHFDISIQSSPERQEGGEGGDCKEGKEMLTSPTSRQKVLNLVDTTSGAQTM